ncbi:MAG: low molecular weight phosphotyrosine protein phosphatase [Gammaproteobacteria bacterium]|nr:MAG: low molecular weight phosphotyrosine protein phosphatase [Gammaproteobacteria bacterium]
MIKVLFVCMGNICRSPLAEGAFSNLLEQYRLGGFISADSAGTHDYHVGEPPDPRAQASALRRGMDISAQRARLVQREDFARFDYILAMDRQNYARLEKLSTPDGRRKLGLFLDYAPHLGEVEVPDPYYGGPGGFERVLDMVEEAAQGLLEHIRKQHL